MPFSFLLYLGYLIDYVNQIKLMFLQKNELN